MKPTIEGQIDIRTLGEIAIAADEGAMRDPWPASIIEALKHRDYPMNGQEIFIEAIRHFFKRRPPKSSIVSNRMAGAIRHLCRLGKIECIANRPGSTELQIIPAVAWAHLILELSSCDRPKARARDCELPPHGCATHDWPGLFFLPLPTGRLIQWLGEGKAVIYENAVYSQISESSRPAPRANNHMPAITGRQKPGPEPTERARVIDALRKDGRSLQELRSEKQEVLCAEFETSRATLRRALAGLESTG